MAGHAVVQLAPGNGEVIVRYDDGSLSGLPNGLSVFDLSQGQAVSFVAGSQTGACAVLPAGVVSCTPSMNGIQTTDMAGFSAVDVGESHVCALTQGGEVRCWGGDCASYPPGTKYWCPDKPLADHSVVVALGQRATALGTGATEFSCALLADGSVRCWVLYDWCTNAAGGADPCAVTDRVPSVVGGAVSTTGAGQARKYGAWRAIDLGTRP